MGPNVCYDGNWGRRRRKTGLKMILCPLFGAQDLLRRRNNFLMSPSGVILLAKAWPSAGRNGCNAVLWFLSYQVGTGVKICRECRAEENQASRLFSEERSSRDDGRLLSKLYLSRNSWQTPRWYPAIVQKTPLWLRARLCEIKLGAPPGHRFLFSETVLPWNQLLLHDKWLNGDHKHLPATYRGQWPVRKMHLFVSRMSLCFPPAGLFHVCCWCAWWGERVGGTWLKGKGFICDICGLETHFEMFQVQDFLIYEKRAAKKACYLSETLSYSWLLYLDLEHSAFLSAKIYLQLKSISLSHYLSGWLSSLG